MHTDYVAKINSIEEVVRYGLCTGCCMCAGICPQHAIEMREDRTMTLHPRLNENCKDCGLCLEVCPGLSDCSLHDRYLANYGIKKAWLAHAKSDKVRYTGQSGGAISALLIDAMESGFCTGVLVTKNMPENPLRNRGFIARNTKDILSAAKSKYCSVNWSSALEEIRHGERLIAVGIPCQLRGLRNAQSLIEKRYDAQILLYLGVVCDGIMNYCFQDFALRYAKVKPPIVEFVYKDKRFGWPGDLKIRVPSKTLFLPNGFRISVKNLFRPERCRICSDKLNSSADLIFGDAYIKGLHEQAKGYSLIGARTKVGEAFFKSAVKSGAIWDSDLSVTKLLECHRPQERIFTSGCYWKVHCLINRILPSMRQSPHQNESYLKWFQKLIMFLIVSFDYLAARLFLNPTVRSLFTYQPMFYLLTRTLALRNKMFAFVKRRVSQMD